MNKHGILIIMLFLAILLPSLSWGKVNTASVSCEINKPLDCGFTWADGDQLVIGNNVTVTIPANYTVVAGPDDGSSDAISTPLTSGNGVLIVNGTLQLRGNVKQANAPWTVNGGGVVEGYSATTSYTWQIGLAAGAVNNSYLVLHGTGRGANRVIVRTAAGSTARFGGFTNGATNRTALTTPPAGSITGAGKIRATFARFENIGDSTNKYHSIITTLNSGGNDESYFEDCIFDGCTQVFVGLVAKSKIRFLRTSFLNPIVGTTYDKSLVLAGRLVSGGNEPMDTSGERKIWDCAFRGGAVFTYAASWDIRRNVFLSGTGGNAIYGYNSRLIFDQFLDNIVGRIVKYDLIGKPVNDDSGMQLPYINQPAGQQTQRTVLLQQNDGDPDVIRQLDPPTMPNGLLEYEHDGIVVEFEQGIGAGSGATYILAGNPVNANSRLTLKNMLVVPTWGNGIAYSPTAAIVTTTATNLANLAKFSLKNVTVGSPLQDFCGLLGFEISSGALAGSRAGQFEANNNIVYNPNGTSQGYMAYATGTSSAPTGTDSIFNFHHNAMNNMATAPYGGGVSTIPPYYRGRNITEAKFSVPPGSGDTTLPVVTLGGPDKHFLAWIQTAYPGITTFTDALLKLLTKNNDSDPLSLDHTQYYHWIRAAYQPPGSLATAGIADDGITPTYVGAVPPNQDVTAPTIGTFTLPATSSTLTVPVSITAGDDTGIAGYFLSENGTVPSGIAPGWSVTPPSVFTFTALGSHTLFAWVKDIAGNLSERSSATVLIQDTTPPAVSITGKPTDPTNQTSGSITFSADESGSTFTCSLDGGSYALCASPYNFAGFCAGLHSFSVKATDPAGNEGLPVSYTWTIDLTPPDTSITGGQPSNPTTSTSVAFVFTATEIGSTFQCQLDGGGWVSCSSGNSYTGLSTGSHTFQLRATDPSGNTDASPASYTWTVNPTSCYVKIGSVCYTSISGAYTAANSGDTILAQAMTFAENLAANRLISVAIRGGYDPTFGSLIGVSTIQSLTISAGTVDVGGVGIQ